MKVTIVIPNYNGKHFMEPCLSSLSEQTYKNFHILVVDNASSDGSIEYMEENYPDIELIKLQKNFGFSKAVNIGIQHSRTPYVILLNNDTTVDTRYVEEMVKAIENGRGEGLSIVMRYSIIWKKIKLYLVRMGGKIDKR